RLLSQSVVVPERSRLPFTAASRHSQRLGPGIENVRFGPDGHVRVHERGSTQSASFDDRDIRIEVELVETEWIQQLVVVMGQKSSWAVGELPNGPFLASFQDAHLQFRVEVGVG